jgi:hypothetical protein
MAAAARANCRNTKQKERTEYIERDGGRERESEKTTGLRERGQKGEYDKGRLRVASLS